MKTFANHNEIANVIKAELDDLRSEMYEAWKIYKAVWGDSDHVDAIRSNEFESYMSLKKQVSALEDNLDFHEIMAQPHAYATEHLYTDAHAYEILEEKNAKTMLVRRLKATIKPEAAKALHDSFVPGGFCGHTDNDLQEWNYESDTTAPIETIRLHKDGSWKSASGHTFIISAEPHEFYDYNF